MEKWTLVLVLHVGALYNAAFCSPPRPVNVLFSSINLRNCLHWLPGNQTQPGTYFWVQYAIYGERGQWNEVPHCRSLELTWCDLTNQTQDLEHGYFARVRAADQSGFSKWKVTQQRFDPKSDTIIGPPLVTLVLNGTSAIVNIKSPMRYQPDNSKPKMTMLEVYPQMTYNLFIADSKNLTQHITFSSGQYVYRLMAYDTEYCFAAQTRFNSMPIECQRSTWHCINTPQDPVIGQLRSVVVGIVVLFSCICVLGVGGYYIHYLVWGKEEKWPHALEPRPHRVSPLTFTPEHVGYIAAKPPPPPDLYVSMPKLPIGTLPDLLSYAPQGQGVSPEPEAPWEDSQESGGTDYGFVRGVSFTGGQVGSEDPREGPGHGGEEEEKEKEKEVEEEEEVEEVEEEEVEEEEDKDEDEEDPGMINWDRERGVLMFPETRAWGEGCLDHWRLGAGQPGSRVGEEEEEVQETGEEGGTGGVRLENVFVRQGSEEQRENAREMEWEMGSLLANWSLVVQMDE